ncbi:NAD(P)/FAD-dependent oxidoreductase [Amycolatopsis suaedae]|uniref:NAD(P)/FAD-dependent oxidoreductase n=1 Tax=Amycolatopsis suaedae TaxID=2510978 RepID=A0A4Q7IZY0_9PSEU|nr:FAD-dependent oxidoreductase [Amycolatopsis suaedae]RZQ59666.1 NAD(P)/FAD-dependent oxidoreductase [Amycolatopsis suaedae]
MNPVVVVGAGAAGLATVEGLRRNGFSGPLTWVGAESELPYDRPPLSKEVLRGDWQPDRVRLCEDAADLRTGLPAVAADLTARTVTLADGDVLPFGTLVVATGVAPRTLPGTEGLRGVHTLRTLADTATLRAGLEPGRRVVIVGAGFLGCEVACSAAGLGCRVTVVEPQPVPLAAAVGERVGTMLAGLHRANGVELRTGAGVRELGSAGGAVESVVLTDGTELAADLVLVAIGSVPATGWLDGSGLDCSDGLVCDEYCAAAPGVYAVGDVASWFHAGFGTRMRLEHRTNAGEQGLYVARRITGQAGDPFTPVPYFWSDQYDLKLQAFGDLRGHDEVRVVHGEVSPDGFVALYRRGDRLAGALGVRRMRALRQWHRHIAAGALWTDVI